MALCPSVYGTFTVRHMPFYFGPCTVHR
jgi:hypothetical protein